MNKIAIIGAGNMGSAIARGLQGKGYDITVANPHTGRLETLAADCPGITVTTDNAEAASGADIVILAVKPYIVPGVIHEISAATGYGTDAVAVSLAAPLCLADLRKLFRDTAPEASEPRLVKAIPNTALSVGRSMTFISAQNVDASDLAEVEAVFRACGDVALIPENLMPAATALCSCGIAYAMRYIRAATEGAVQMGIRPADALRYEIATLQGACALLEASGSHPEAEIDKVTTPGGITIRGLNAMEREGFTNAVIQGLLASV